MKQKTYSTQKHKWEKAVLVQRVTLDKNEKKFTPEYSLAELESLTVTAGAQVVSQVVQNLEKANAKYFIGKGKVQEIKQLVEEQAATTVIFDHELTASHVRNLENILGCKIIDRTQLILDIFAQRAKTKEAILQVELAQLNYCLPRLVGGSSHLSRLGGGIGTRGPGETKLETDRRHFRQRITNLSRQVEEITKSRSLYHHHRHKERAIQVSLVGYTNAGKSTLMNQLTDAGIYVADKLFATLDSTSRVCKLPCGKSLILTDTVGFIQKLPHELVAAFRSTLEEVKQADLLLHVVDASSPMRDQQIEAVNEVLSDLGVGNKPTIQVFNKSDHACFSVQEDPFRLGICAFKEGDLVKLKNTIETHLLGKTKCFRLPMNRLDLISLLYQIGKVITQKTENETFILKVKINQEDWERYGQSLAPYRFI